jgi:hypothetical protein
VARRQRFRAHHVERRAGDGSRLQRGGERHRVHAGAARGVDEEGARLHARERPGADDATRLVFERAVQRDVVAGEHLVEACLLDAEGVHGGLVHVGIGRFHGETKAGRSPRHRAADATQADDAERLVPDAARLAAGLVVPGPRQDAVVQAADVAPQIEQETEGVVGQVGRAVVGGVGDHDAALGGGHVDAVEARRHESDDPAARQLVEHKRCQRCVRGDERVGAAHSAMTPSSLSSSSLTKEIASPEPANTASSTILSDAPRSVWITSTSSTSGQAVHGPHARASGRASSAGAQPGRTSGSLS